MQRLLGWWFAASAAILLVAYPVSAQESSTSSTEEQAASTSVADASSESFVPVLRERKMSEDELFAHRRGWTSSEAPAFAHAGARSARPGGEIPTTASGKRIDDAALIGLSDVKLRSFAAERREGLLTLRERVMEGIDELRRSMDSAPQLDPGVGASYAELFDMIAAMENEVANIEAAQVELEQYDEIDVLQDIDQRLKRARVHLHMMEESADAEEFESYASILTTALGLIEQQSAAFATR